MFIAAGGAGIDPLVQDIGVCLVVSGILAVIFTRLKLPDIAAFLAAGVIVGPVVGHIVTDTANIKTIANLGLILLLFVIGLEIDLRKLLASGKTLIVTGLLQFPLCVAFGFGVAHLLAFTGISVLQETYAPRYIGFATAASSTLIVVSLLQGRRQLDTTVGRMALGLLIFQDIWAIVVLAIQPNFDKPEIGPVAATFLGTGILIVIAGVLAKFVLPTAGRWIARVPELMLVAALAWCFGVGFLGSNLEPLLGIVGIHLHVSVSMEMGALIAGASIATLPYSTNVVSKVGVVKDFFVTLFFVGLGMGIPAPDGVSVVLLALVLGVVAILARYLIFFPLLYVTGLDRRNAFVASTRLAQISEFCLVIAYIGLNLGHVSDTFVSTIIFAFVPTALLSPVLFSVGDKLHDRMGGLLSSLGFKLPESKGESQEEPSYDYVLLGFHRVASSLLEEMRRRAPHLLERVLVLDFNVALHPKIAETGAAVQYIDFSNPDALHHVGIEHAKVIVCTISDDLLKGTTNRRVVQIVREIAPEATILANAIEMDETKHVYEAGADYVYHERVKVAQALLLAIESASDGDIQGYRLRREELTGEWHERQEVLP